MKGVFGVVGLSLATVVDSVKDICKDKDLKFLFLDKKPMPKSIRKAEVIVASGFDAFRLNLEALNTSKAVVVIADNPLSLSEIKDVVFIDAVRRKGESFRFILQKPNYGLVLSALKSKDSLEVTTQKLDVIPTLIKSQKSSGFLDLLQLVIYRVFDVRKRNIFLPLFYKRMFTGNNKDFLASVEPLRPKRGFGKEKFDEFVDLINSDYGKALSKAVKEYKKDKEAVELSKKYSVDAYDLRYVVKSGAKLYKKTGTVKEAIEACVNKDKTKKAKKNAEAK